MTHLRIKSALAALLLAPVMAPAAPRQMTLAEAQETLSLPLLEADANAVIISDGTNNVAFRPGFRRVAVNDVAVWLNEPAEPDFKNTLRVARPDLERLLAPILAALGKTRGDGDEGGSPERFAPLPGKSAPPPEQPKQPSIVFLDPGHGGDDCGAVSAATGQQEKDLVLDVALRTGAILQDAGFAVAFSRTNDTFVSLHERATLAADANAAIFVSVHANTTGNAMALGIETFTLSHAGSDSTSGDSRISKKEWPGNAFDPQSAVLGYLVQAAVNTGRGDADRGLRHARFQVLREAPCPAILVECGFLSNEDENISLASPRYRQRVAAAIASGVVAYARQAEAPPPATPTP